MPSLTYLYKPCQIYNYIFGYSKIWFILFVTLISNEQAKKNPADEKVEQAFKN